MTGSLVLDESLCNTDFTVGWLLNSLVKNDKEFIQKHGNRKVKEISTRDISGGKGMFSIVLKCEISFQDSDTDGYTTIVKVPGRFVFDELNSKGEGVPKGENINIVEMHATEVKFYSIFKDRLSKILPKVYFTQLWVPGEHQGCLHMEDLSQRGISLNYFDCLNHGQIRNVIRSLAHFHKEIICSDEAEWRGKFDPSNLKFFDHISHAVNGFINTFMKYVKNEGQKQTFMRYFDDPKLGKLIRQPSFYRYVPTQAHLDAGIQTTLVHGDLWNNNIIFKRDSNGYISNEVEAFLDWQTVQEGNLACDFARLLTCSCEGDIRREAEFYIFDFFVDCLQEELQTVGKKVPYTGKQLRDLYDYALASHAIHPIFMMPMFFATKVNKPEEAVLDRARIDRCLLRALHTLEDVKSLVDSGKFDRWLNEDVL